MGTSAIRSLFLALTIFLFGCSNTSHLDVYLDPKFTPEERAGIVEALLIWQDVIPEIQISIQEGLEFPEVLDESDVPIRRGLNQKDYELQCNPPVGSVGMESQSKGICLQAEYINAHGKRWREITLHEFGHRLGLEHRNPPSVMAPLYPDISSYPTCNDVNAARAANGLGAICVY